MDDRAGGRAPALLAAAVALTVALSGCAPSDEGPEIGEGQMAAPTEPPPIPAAEGGPGPLDAQVERIEPGWIDRTVDATEIPERALEAYAGAELWAQHEDPECQLRWNTLAGIGAVESHHGTLDGNALQADGTTVEPIIGVPLDGTDGVAEVPDTDGGELDGDTTYDRAVGPMQFLPEVWQQYGRDGSGDGEANPHNIDDAAVSAVAHLCDGGTDLSDDSDWVDAVLGYNPSEDYVRNVNAYAEYVVESLAAAEDETG